MDVPLHLLPHDRAEAARNMALDWALLEGWSAREAVRLRFYGWEQETFTFGYSQPLAGVQAAIAPFDGVDLCRRPTGGGLVDHRADLTYALVIPPGHALCRAPALESYRTVHAALAGALQEGGRACALQEDCQPCGDALAVCFARPSRYDIITPEGAKIAGAAQKRSRHGLLVQGSLERGLLPALLTADALAESFAAHLSRDLRLHRDKPPLDRPAEECVRPLEQKIRAPEWNARR